MASRGRGRGTNSFTQEQLQVLGCIGKDMPSVTAAPPPLFPMLPSKPVPLDNSSERKYKVLWKEDFINYLRDSPYFTYPKNSEQKVQRYSDTYINVLENDTKIKMKAEFLWDLMPTELRPNYKRTQKMEKSSELIKKIKVENIDEKLKILEQKEEMSNKTVEIKEEPKSDEEEEKELEEEFEDEEMDDENDYGNNYFDNGEAFNEEDDNLDDGPIY